MRKSIRIIFKFIVGGSRLQQVCQQIYWSNAEKKMLYGYSWSLDTTSYSERVRKTSLKEFVPRRSTHSLLLFHLHFHLYCIAVKIFELLRSCDHKFYMKTLKPQNIFFWYHSSKSTAFFFFIEEENICSFIFLVYR